MRSWGEAARRLRGCYRNAVICSCVTPFPTFCRLWGVGVRTGNRQPKQPVLRLVVLSCGYLATCGEKGYLIIRIDLIRNRREVWRKLPSITTAPSGWKVNSRFATPVERPLTCQGGPRLAYAAVGI